MTPQMPVGGGRADDVIQLHRTARPLVGPIAVPAIFGDPKADECARAGGNLAAKVLDIGASKQAQVTGLHVSGLVQIEQQRDELGLGIGVDLAILHSRMTAQRCRYRSVTEVDLELPRHELAKLAAAEGFDQRTESLTVVHPIQGIAPAPQLSGKIFEDRGEMISSNDVLHHETFFNSDVAMF